MILGEVFNKANKLLVAISEIYFYAVVPSTLFADGVHLTTAGYQLWADTMNPLLNELIQQ